MKPDATLTIMNLRFWPDYHGGVEQHMWHLATQAAKVMPVQVLAENRLAVEPCEKLHENLIIHRGEVIDMGRLWRWPMLVRTKFWVKMLKAHPPTGWIWSVDTSAILAAKLCGHGDRTVFNPPGCWAAMQQTYLAHRQVTTMKISRILRWQEKLSYRYAAKVIVASDAIAQQYQTFYKADSKRDKIQVVPRGAGTEFIKQLPNAATSRKKWDIAKDAFVVGFVGRLDPCKDLPFLIHACSLPKVLREQDRLLIVGIGPDQGRIEKAIADDGMSKKVILAGQCIDDELRATYASMSCFVLPSLYEGYGMVILEAMAAGLAVIGRKGNGVDRFTSMAEMIKEDETGLLFDNDIQTLANHLKRLREQPMLTKKLGQAARLKLEKRPWHVVIGQYLKALDLPCDIPATSIQEMIASENSN